jgi:dihydropteroate synthase
LTEQIEVLNCAGKMLDLRSTRVMGVLNVTPDSFSDGGKWASTESAVERGFGMIEAGADIIDVGGESTRPGAFPVSIDEEMGRVVPVIEDLAQHPGVIISIDTSKPEVMRAAVLAGAGLINDVYALRLEGSLDAVAELGVPVCLMHMLGTPGDMQSNPQYLDVVEEVESFLLQRATVCRSAGIDREQILIDPGFGFGKTFNHNVKLFSALSRLCAHGYPVVAGLSRKAMLGTITGRPADQRVAASVAAAVLSVNKGASIVRVHDVEQTVDALRVTAILSQESERA